ncbi:hypothetical protein ACVWWO_003432 [Bradyrhizobium sp. F1.13.1]
MSGMANPSSVATRSCNRLRSAAWSARQSLYQTVFGGKSARKRPEEFALECRDTVDARGLPSRGAQMPAAVAPDCPNLIQSVDVRIIKRQAHIARRLKSNARRVSCQIGRVVDVNRSRRGHNPLARRPNVGGGHAPHNGNGRTQQRPNYSVSVETLVSPSSAATSERSSKPPRPPYRMTRASRPRASPWRASPPKRWRRLRERSAPCRQRLARLDVAM